MRKIYSFILCLVLVSTTYAATIQGVVVDSENQPLIGVSVIYGGTTVITDFDGVFSMDVDENSELQFSLIGYQSATQAAQDGMVVVLKEKGAGSSSKNDWQMVNVSLEAGYDHGCVRHYSGLPNFAPQRTKTDSRMDGFHVGANVQLNFLKGQHIPSLVIGLNYQFLCYDLIKTDEAVRKEKAAFFDAIRNSSRESAIFKCYLTMHTIQLPIRVQYAYQINDFRIFAFTGPQFRFHVALQQSLEASWNIDGMKNGSKSMSDLISGRVKFIDWGNGIKTSQEYIPFYDNFTYTYITIDADGKKEVEKGQINVAEESGDDFMPWFDMSWGFGVGCAWRNISLNISYDLGMMNILPKNERIVSKKYSAERRYIDNSDVLAVTLGYRF